MMLLGLDKTYKKEKKDHRCAIQFNFGSRSRRGQKRIQFYDTRQTTETKTYPWSSLSKISETISWLLQTTPSSIDLCCSATPWRTWRSSLFKEERERERVRVCAYYKWGEEESKKTRADRQKREIFCPQTDWQTDADTEREKEISKSKLLFIH